MKVSVKGVTIELTSDQINHVESEIAKREKELNSFVKVLKHFGFNKVNTRGWQNPDQSCWSNDQHGWFVEIIDYGSFKTCVFHGKPLDEGSPWGKEYNSPESASKGIFDALDLLNNTA